MHKPLPPGLCLQSCTARSQQAPQQLPHLAVVLDLHALHHHAVAQAHAVADHATLADADVRACTQQRQQTGKHSRTKQRPALLHTSAAASIPGTTSPNAVHIDRVDKSCLGSTAETAALSSDQLCCMPTYEAAAANGRAGCHQHVARVVRPAGQCCTAVDAQVVQVQRQACTAWPQKMVEALMCRAVRLGLAAVQAVLLDCGLKQSKWLTAAAHAVLTLACSCQAAAMQPALCALAPTCCNPCCA